MGTNMLFRSAIDREVITLFTDEPFAIRYNHFVVHELFLSRPLQAPERLISTAEHSLTWETYSNFLCRVILFLFSGCADEENQTNAVGTSETVACCVRRIS